MQLSALRGPHWTSLPPTPPPGRGASSAGWETIARLRGIVAYRGEKGSGLTTLLPAAPPVCSQAVGMRGRGDVPAGAFRSGCR